MGFPGSRFMLFHRMVLLPPLVLLTLTCLYTSSTLSPFSSTHHLSFSQDVQCFSCETSSFPSRSFLSLANFPTSSYIRDIVLRHNVLKVEDSFGETSTEPVSRLNANEVVESADLKAHEEVAEKVDPFPDTMSRIRKEELSHSAVEEAAAVEEVATVEESVPAEVTLEKEPVHEEKQDEIVPVEVLERVSPAEEKVELVVEEKVDNVTPTETKGEIVTTTAAVEVVEKPKEEDFQPENRHLTSEDHVVEQPGVPIEVNPQATAVAVQVVTEVVPESPVVLPPAPVKKEDVLQFTYDNITKEIRVAGLAVERLMDRITKSGLPTLDGNLAPGADVDRNLLLRGGFPQGVPLKTQESCEGRLVYVYDLPTKFNADLVGQCDTLLRWFNFCDYFMNEGMGTAVPTDELNDRGEKVLVPEGSWYLTHQYALELIFHARLKHYPCLTTDVNRANLFFVPYYAGLDVIRWHFKANVSNDRRDELTLDLMTWLETQESWKRNNGIDHVFVLGKIGWDFRRADNSGHWGSKLLRLPNMGTPTKVLIERDPWHGNDVGVPHPTFFHPKDDDEIRTWLTHVEQSERRYLVSFAGMPRPNMLGNVRGHLIQQCLDHSDDCFLLRCVQTLCLRPDSTMNLFLHSHFCMQPPGDSPTRRSVFDSLVGGCIPVLFDPYTAYYQYPWHLPQNASSYSVYIPSTHVMGGTADIVDILKSISPEERTAMRTRIIREIIPGLLYSKPGTSHSDFRDAFDISIEALLHRVANLRAEQKFR